MSKPEQTDRPRRSGGQAAARALGWAIGIAVVLGTAALVVVAMNKPEAQVAGVMKPPRKCPPDVSVPARGLGQPVDDVLGVRPGMNAHDVEETVKCVSEDYAIEPIEYRAAGAPIDGRKTRRALRAKRGAETLTFALFGPQGQERVAGGWREAFFDAGVGPPLATIEGMIIAQYGPPHEARDTPAGARILTWTYAPDGRALRVRPPEGDIPAMVSYMAAGWTVAACVRNAKVDPAMAPVWDGRCGLTIQAEIEPTLSDHTHTARWRLVALDQGTLARQAAPLRAMGAAAQQ